MKTTLFSYRKNEIKIETKKNQISPNYKTKLTLKKNKNRLIKSDKINIIYFYNGHMLKLLTHNV